MWRCPTPKARVLAWWLAVGSRRLDIATLVVAAPRTPTNKPSQSD